MDTPPQSNLNSINEAQNAAETRPVTESARNNNSMIDPISEVTNNEQVEGEGEGTEAYSIPTHAGWFSWTSIHNIERRALPEFFDGKSQSKNSKTYKEYRDAIISKYREQPQQPLTFTQIRRLLIGDVNTIRRVFDFLDHWGLINYHAKKSNQPSQESAWPAPPIALLQAEPPAGLRLARPTINPSQSLLLSHSSVPALPMAGLSTRSSVFLSKSSTSTLVTPGTVPSVAPDGPIVFQCNVCSSDCSAARYHCQTQPDIDLCVNCFGDNKFGPGLTAGDFIYIHHSNLQTRSGEWSDHESLLLLEGLEMYGDKWTDVAQHVGTKNRAECILHFLQLPIEDPFLEDESAAATPATSHGIRKSDAPAEEQQKRPKTESQGEVTATMDSGTVTPFSDAGNPVMAQVAFLASMVGPRVAAAAAQAALTVLTEEEPSVQNWLQSTLDNAASADPATDVDIMEQSEDASKALDNHTSGDDAGVSMQQSISAVKMRAAAATALSAAAVKAKLLADQEERHMQALVSSIIEKQLRKMDMKMAHFDELEEVLNREREQVDRQRMQLYAERVKLAASSAGPTPATMNVFNTPPANINVGSASLTTPLTASTMVPINPHAAGQLLSTNPPVGQLLSTNPPVGQLLSTNPPANP